MVEALLGEEELTRAIAFDQLGSFLGLAVYGSFIAAHYGSSEGGVGPVALRLLRFPPFIAVLASIPLRWVELPAGAEDVLGALGSLVAPIRSEEHTSELQSLMRISYAVFCLKKKKRHK